MSKCVKVLLFLAKLRFPPPIPTDSRSNELLAVSCVDATGDRTLAAVKAATSYVLLWSFADALAPHASLLAPYDVSTLRFYPNDRHYLVGGLANGQLIIWRLSPLDLG